MTAADIKSLLNLQPHPREGGWFIRTYESPDFLTLPRYPDARRTSTAIYYLLEPDTFSELHLLASDEIFHLYLGGPVEMLQLHPATNTAPAHTETHIIGTDLAAGHRPQLTVPRNVWQGSRLLHRDDPNAFALLGCTVSPGFEFADYTTAPRADLIAQFPEAAPLITALTNS